MVNREIKLTFRKSDFKEVYYRNNNGHLFLSSTTKKNVKYSCLALTGVIISILLCNYYNEYWAIFIASLFIFGFQLIGLLVSISRLLKWKNSVNAFLDRTSKHQSHSIVISDNAFSVIQDNNEIIAKWSEFKTAEITDQFVGIVGAQNYLIPAKSMNADDYKFLRDTVSSKIKNGL